jgi:ribonuclease BN (tRNA processing enzyme)
MSNSILFLGTSHGSPSMTRFCSSTLYRFGETSLLVDAGEPVSALLLRNNFKSSLLDAVLLTHLHVDHDGGLASLIYAMTVHPVENHRPKLYFSGPGRY